MVSVFSILDALALGWFVLAWLGFDLALRKAWVGRRSLSDRMDERRREWMAIAARRDLRMIDTQILAGLQQGTAFFGSASILAIGGALAMLNATDQVALLVAELPNDLDFVRARYEMKVFGLVLIFTYAFFKFAWSYRLFNYCSILLGAVPHPRDAEESVCASSAREAAEMNILAGRHFTAGMRGIFFALAYLGWFLGPLVLIGSTFFVLLVLVRRQYFSRARGIVDGLTY